MMGRQRMEAGMAVSGRGAFRNETRTTRLERLHGPKDPILGHGCFLPRSGRSADRRRWKSASGIGESGRRRMGHLRSDETRYGFAVATGERTLPSDTQTVPS